MSKNTIELLDKKDIKLGHMIRWKEAVRQLIVPVFEAADTLKEEVVTRNGENEGGEVESVRVFKITDLLRSYSDVEFYYRVCVCAARAGIFSEKVSESDLDEWSPAVAKRLGPDAWSMMSELEREESDPN